MKIVKGSVAFGGVLLCVLVVVQYVNFDAKNLTQLFQPTPTPTPTIIDILGDAMWKADGSPEEFQSYFYGDMLVVSARNCDLDFDETGRLLMNASENLTKVRPATKAPHLNLMLLIKDSLGDSSCADFLSNRRRLVEELESR